VLNTGVVNNVLYSAAIMIVPNAELVDDTASPEVDLNSKITP
jgi:hypothetical protein